MKRLLPLLACCVALAAGELRAAALAGKISFVTKRGQNPNAAETLVWLEPLGASRAARRPAATFQMLTRNKNITPHVLAIPVGSTVEFPNDDPISHNLFSLASQNGFDLGLYRKGAGKAHKFDAAGIVNVYCNVHPNMGAVIHVMSTPYYTFADRNGAYSFDVPPGRYRVNAWNEQGGMVQQELEVPAAGMPALALTLDSRNYRAQTHTNKEGKAYQAPPRDY
jgi:plastocyanin